MAVSAFGTIFIQFDKGSYSPREQVNGTIFLNVFQNYPGAREVSVLIRGFEDTRLIERKTRTTTHRVGKTTTTRTHTYYVTHQDYNAFFNHQFVIYRFSTDFIPAGQYTFPFSFALPAGLPSTFNHTFHRYGANHAKVNYTVGARVGAFMQLGAPISCTQNFVLNQELIASTGNVRKEICKEVKSCCCCSKGDSKIVSYFEKNDYCPGETAFMITEVDNSKCKADILELKGTFKQLLRINARSYSTTLPFDHQTLVMQGIKQGETLLGEQAKRFSLQLKSTNGEYLQPTCRGKLVSNEYHLVNSLKMDACICCDIHPTCSLVLNLRNPDQQTTRWEAMPSNWNPQQMSAYNAVFTTEFGMPMQMQGGSSESEKEGDHGQHGNPQHMDYPPGPPGQYPQAPPGQYPQQGMPGMPPMAGMPPGPGPQYPYPGQPGAPS